MSSRCPMSSVRCRRVPSVARCAKSFDQVFAEPLYLALGDLRVVAASGDPRAAWPLVDLLRFHQGGPLERDLTRALRKLVGRKLGPDWVGYTDLLLQADIPAPQGYLCWKRAVFLASEPAWKPFFAAAPTSTGDMSPGAGYSGTGFQRSTVHGWCPDAAAPGSPTTTSSSAWSAGVRHGRTRDVSWSCTRSSMTNSGDGRWP